MDGPRPTDAGSPKLKIIRIELEWDDGRIERAEGEDAEAIWRAYNDAIASQLAHGMPYRWPKMVVVREPGAAPPFEPTRQVPAPATPVVETLAGLIDLAYGSTSTRLRNTLAEAMRASGPVWHLASDRYRERFLYSWFDGKVRRLTEATGKAVAGGPWPDSSSVRLSEETRRRLGPRRNP